MNSGGNRKNLKASVVVASHPIGTEARQGSSGQRVQTPDAQPAEGDNLGSSIPQSAHLTRRGYPGDGEGVQPTPSPPSPTNRRGRQTLGLHAIAMHAYIAACNRRGIYPSCGDVAREFEMSDVSRAKRIWEALRRAGKAIRNDRGLVAQ